MLGIDALHLALSAVESGMLEAAVSDLVTKTALIPVAQKRGVGRSVKSQIKVWKAKTKSRASHVCETEQFADEINHYQSVIQLTEDQFMRQFDDIVDAILPSSDFYEQANRFKHGTQRHDNPMFPHHFCRHWYATIEDSIKVAQSKQIELDKERLLADIYRKLETLSQMDEVTVSGEEGQLGQLWDMAGAKLSRSDFTAIKQTATFLSKHHQLHQIAQELGRMAGEIDDPDLNVTLAEELVFVEETSDEATDDIVGIHESDDLNKLLPNETMFLAYPELETIFYKHMADKRLMTYRTQGKARTVRKLEAHTPAHKDAVIEKGPIIICVDASGSMSGFPERCAKAMAYALLQIALTDKRECLVYLFSTQHISYQMTEADGLKEAANFLSYKFHGGTAFEPVMEDAVNQMEKSQFRNADMLVISDFISPKLSEGLVQKMNSLSSDHNRFHALTLSKFSNPELLGMYNKTWHYHPTVMEKLMKFRK
ncbi:protein viaA (plasmid) [Vibrio sp. qd031]|uniref:ATPase RavA stimulator ViaA n=1 Tax=Vibrio sp. qd031 TaxID=1603038 RepID=UPI000A10A3E4|nr:ATPase RavA stimulator ViaA [Vibrio sp. qd031]ORT52495.1 protein viaA [Vibrio sp. qd031]